MMSQQHQPLWYKRQLLTFLVGNRLNDIHRPKKGLGHSVLSGLHGNHQI